jgi:hypothetical protein
MGGRSTGSCRSSRISAPTTSRSPWNGPGDGRWRGSWTTTCREASRTCSVTAATTRSRFVRCSQRTLPTRVLRPPGGRAASLLRPAGADRAVVAPAAGSR